VPTAGGERQITLRYRPRWRTPAVSLATFGALVALGLAAWRPGRQIPDGRARSVLFSARERTG